MLKALGQTLMEAKEEFYALSTATRRDAGRQLDRHRGRHRHLCCPTLERSPVSCQTRDARRWRRRTPVARNTFSGQHILTPLEGVAIHINAFNFPCWACWEKLAPTLLAGMPAIVKPASQTAYRPS